MPHPRATVEKGDFRPADLDGKVGKARHMEGGHEVLDEQGSILGTGADGRATGKVQGVAQMQRQSQAQVGALEPKALTRLCGKQPHGDVETARTQGRTGAQGCGGLRRDQQCMAVQISQGLGGGQGAKGPRLPYGKAGCRRVIRLRRGGDVGVRRHRRVTSSGDECRTVTLRVVALR